MRSGYDYSKIGKVQSNKIMQQENISVNTGLLGLLYSSQGTQNGLCDNYWFSLQDFAKVKSVR